MTGDVAIAVGLFVASWLLANFLTPYFAKLGRRWNVIDNPGERKVHDTPTPRTGGMAIFATIAICVAVGIAVLPRLQQAFFHQPAFFLSLGIGGTLTFLIGLYDDFTNAGIWQRLLTETIAALIAVYFGDIVIERLAVPFYGILQLGPASIPLTVFWIVGVTNAFNIIDGLDGLAGGITFIACFGVFVVAVLNGDGMAMAALALLAGSCLGFLRYNNHPAVVFLGDSGALILGFLLACISVETSLKRSTGMALIIPMQMLAVPLLDTLYSMGRRLVSTIVRADDFSPKALLSMFRADREHIHHVLLDVGFSHPRAVWVLYLLSGFIMTFGLLTALTLNDRISLLFLMAGLAGFLIVRHFGESLPFIRRWKKVERESGQHPPISGEHDAIHKDRDSSGPHRTVSSDRDSSGPHPAVGGE